MAKLALSLKDERLTTPDRHILLLFALHCPYDGKTKKERNTCAPGNEALAKESGFTEKAVSNINARLQSYGYIQLIERGHNVGRKAKNSTWQVNLF